MTKEELIAYIKELESKRAFTYEDQMKLEILDNSPFTVWASDRNCIIKLWMGQCESLYGFSSKEVIGKDFVDLFVAKDEKVAARRDQINIIDNGAIFHNIANDIGKNGNTLQLITNCRRIIDPVSGECWNAEMGLIIDYLEQEKDRLKMIVAESQRIKSCISQFIEDTQQVSEGFANRKSSINAAIRECEQKATALGKRTECRKKITEIRSALNKLTQRMNDIYDEHVSNMQSCASFDSCEKIRKSFFEEYEEISDSLEDMALDVFDLSRNYEIEQNLVSLKDSMMKNMSSRTRVLSDFAHTILRKIESEMNDYKEKVTPNPNLESGPFKSFMDMRQEISELKDKAEKTEDKLSSQIINAKSKQDLEIAKTQIEVDIENMRLQMEKIETSLNGGL